ncbi:ankyrin repeat-containing domain protein [Annulohypoxylon bovei var. microspora]|nr:ankyrin repeat-containing domain protein [Annulohypoxylon bovei var. microspora]
MAQQPDINGDAFCIECEEGCHVPSIDCNLTSILAEAITCGNTQLTHSLEQAGVLNHLSGGYRFGVAIIAAAEIEDISYVNKLIDLHHAIEPQEITTALLLSVRNGWDALAMRLLDAGVPFHDPDIPWAQDSLLYATLNAALDAAVEQQNSHITWGILNADIRGCGDKYTLLKAIEWGDRPIITDLLSTFDYPSRYKRQPTGLYFEENLTLEDAATECPPLGFAITFEVDSMFDFLLESKLATKQALTDCLVFAFRERDADFVQFLIDKGADPLDEYILKAALVWSPSMLNVLLRQSHPKEGNLPRGLRTQVLKEAIGQSHQDTSLARTLIMSGVVDIFDTSDDHGVILGKSKLNPLGEAIALSKKSPSNSLDIVMALLDADCNPNDIVEWGMGSYSTPIINQTALLKAIEMMDQDVVKLLLDRSANYNQPANFAVKRTPLQKAAEVGSLELVRMLIARGADVNGKPAVRSGGTALQMAAISGNCNVAAELLRNGALLHTPPPKVNGRWPLEGAAESGRLDMVEFLWKANQETILFEGETGFEKKHCLKAMELAGDRGHFGCRDFIAELSGFSPTIPQID